MKSICSVSGAHRDGLLGAYNKETKYSKRVVFFKIIQYNSKASDFEKHGNDNVT